jgi:hypothetical protein
MDSANWFLLGRKKGIRVNDWVLARDCILVGYWENGMGESEIQCSFILPPYELENRSLICLQAPFTKPLP